MTSTSLITACALFSLALAGCATTRSGAPAPVVRATHDQSVERDQMFAPDGTLVARIAQEAKISERCATASMADQYGTVSAEHLAMHIAANCSQGERARLSAGEPVDVSVNVQKLRIGGGLTVWTDKDGYMLDIRPTAEDPDLAGDVPKQ